MLRNYDLTQKKRIAKTDDVGTSTEIKREDIRIAAKNMAEIEKMLICLMTERGALASDLG